MTKNMNDNETLNASFRLKHPASKIRMVFTIIIALFKHTLNSAYLDIKVPNIILVTNASKPKVIVFFFMIVI